MCFYWVKIIVMDINCGDGNNELKLFLKNIVYEWRENMYFKV